MGGVEENAWVTESFLLYWRRALAVCVV